MVTAADFSMYTEVFTETHVAGIEWVIPIIILFLSLILITRDINKWRVLALPIIIGWSTVGLNISLVFWVLAVITFVIESLTLQILGNMIGATSEAVGKTGKSIARSVEKANIGERIVDKFTKKQETEIKTESKEETK